MGVEEVPVVSAPRSSVERRLRQRWSGSRRRQDPGGRVRLRDLPAALVSPLCRRYRWSTPEVEIRRVDPLL